MPSAALSRKKRIILGLATLGPDVNTGARITDINDFRAILDLLQKEGYNEVDTSNIYAGGKQQAFTREAGWKERRLKLATKFYPGGEQGGHDPANVRAKLEWNLDQLGTDSVDIFYLHGPDRNTPFDSTLEECNRLYKEGKFRQLGLSNFAAYEVAEMVMICNERGWVRPTIYQGMYNAITRNLETELITACHRYGMEVLAYNPLAGGLLSGKIKAKGALPEDEYSRFGSKSAMGALYRSRYFRDANFEVLAEIEEVAKKHDLSLVEVALRWCMHHSVLNVGKDGGDGLVIGISNKHQLESNLKDLEKGPLPDEVVQTLERAWLHVKANSPPYWHGELQYGYQLKDSFRQSHKDSAPPFIDM